MVFSEGLLEDRGPEIIVSDNGEQSFPCSVIIGHHRQVIVNDDRMRDS